MNFLQDSAGNQSSLRLAFLLTLAVSMLVWAALSIATEAMPELPSSITTLLGFLVGGKLVQKQIEVGKP